MAVMQVDLKPAQLQRICKIARRHVSLLRNSQKPQNPDGQPRYLMVGLVS